MVLAVVVLVVVVCCGCVCGVGGEDIGDSDDIGGYGAAEMEFGKHFTLAEVFSK